MPRALIVSNDTGEELELSVVESENPQGKNTITDNPVEKGVNISDHVKAEPLTFSISGVVTGDDAAQKVQMLTRFRENANILTYVGRNALYNLIIESTSTTHDKEVRNGFKFEITFKEIRIAQLQYVDLTNVPIPARPQKNKGKQTAKQKAASSVQQALLAYAAKSKTG